MIKLEVPQCSICLHELNQDLVVTPCGHVFHRKCIEMQVDRNPMCPLDRRTLTLDQLTRLQYSLIEHEDTAFMQELNKLGVDEDEKLTINKMARKLQKVIGERETLK